MRDGKPCNDCKAPVTSMQLGDLPDRQTVEYGRCVYRAATEHRWLREVRQLDGLERMAPLSGWPDEYLAGIVQVWPEYRAAVQMRRSEDKNG